MLALFIGLILFFIILGLAFGFIGARKWFPQTDNINNAIVLVKNGKQYKSYKGKCIETFNKGKNYRYANGNIVMVSSNPDIMPEEYIKHRRIIVVGSNGKIVGTTLGSISSLTESENEELIKGITLGHLASDMLKAMQGKEGFSWVIAGILGLVIGGIICYAIIQATNQTSISPSSIPSQTSPIYPIPQPTDSIPQPMN